MFRWWMPLCLAVIACTVVARMGNLWPPVSGQYTRQQIGLDVAELIENGNTVLPVFASTHFGAASNVASQRKLKSYFPNFQERSICCNCECTCKNPFFCSPCKDKSLCCVKCKKAFCKTRPNGFLVEKGKLVWKPTFFVVCPKKN